MKFLQTPSEYRNKEQYAVDGLKQPHNQSRVRQRLARFFSNRVKDLEYEKYLIMERLYNLGAEE